MQRKKDLGWHFLLCGGTDILLKGMKKIKLKKKEAKNRKKIKLKKEEAKNRGRKDTRYFLTLPVVLEDVIVKEFKVK